jgi:hypothetical protein
MTSFLSNAIRSVGFRSVALRLAAKSPIMTAITARLLMVISVFGIFVAAASLVREGSSVDVLNLMIGFLSLLFSYALLGAAKEIHCRRNGLPVHPW